MFTSSTKYALRTILYLSKNREGKSNTVEEIASEMKIPKPYLGKILQQLSRNDLISSKKGKGGGFYLSEDNLNHRLIDVVICIEGKNVFDQCLLGLPRCSDSNPCILHSHFKKFRLQLEKMVMEESIQDLIKNFSY